MLTIYKPTETDFSHNGLAVLDNIINSATITHILNGNYILDLNLRKDSRGKYKFLQMHSIVKACGQLFRVYSQENIQDDGINIVATLYHISYDINLDIIDDRRAENCRVDEAMRKLILDKRFTVIDTDIETISTAYFVNQIPFKGIEEKIIPRWGGELYQDNFDIGILKTIGRKSPVSIVFRKNIKGFTERRDYTGVYTRVKITGRDGITIGDINGGNDWLESPRIGEYFKPLSAVISIDSENPLELKEYVLNTLWGNVDVPKVEFTVDFIDLSNTVEYRNFNNLKSLNVGDTATVYHEVFGVNLEVKVQKIVRNALSNEVTDIVLGHYMADYVATVDSTITDRINEAGNTIIRQTDSKIELLAKDTQERIDETTSSITKLESSLTLTAESITAELNKQVTSLDGKITNNTSLINATATNIRAELTSQVSTLDGKISNNTSLITATASDIRAEVKSQVSTLDGKISTNTSSIKANAESIQSAVSKIETVGNTVSKHETAINQTADSVEILVRKQANGELTGKNYSFTGDGFTIGATNGSTTALHTDSFSRWKHSNGNYSEANSSGFSRDGRPYHHLISIGSAVVGGSAGVYPSIVTIQLPDYWKGKNFSVTVSMVDTGGGIDNEWVKRTYLCITEINTAQAYFKVRGYWTSITSAGRTNEKELVFSYIAIGG